MRSSLLIRHVQVVPLEGAASPDLVDVRIVDGRIADVGAGLAADGEAELNADGRWIIPGLWDHHVHLTQWARTRSWLDLAGTRSPDEVCAAVGRAVLTASGPVVHGFGYRSGPWSQAPTVAALDAVSGDVPVVLISGDVHNGWLNSAALAALGVPPRDTPLEEYDWYPVLARLETLPRDELAEQRAVAEVIRQASALGVVGVTDLELGRPWTVWADRLDAGMDQLRVRIATYSAHLAEAISLGLRTGTVLPHTYDLVTMGPLKIISDGSLNTRTAYCFEPYADDPSGSRGAMNVSPDELVELLAEAQRHGLEAAVHAIGDAAIGIALDAFARTGIAGSIEHAQLMQARDIPRMADLGVTASVQPAHLLDDRDVTHQCWPDRADRCFPLRSLLDAGVRLALGSDAPVAPLDPWLAMAAAVYRSSDHREPWNPAEALSAQQALAASVDGQRVASGARGDLVLLDENPVALDDDAAAAAGRLRRMPVATTIVGGRVVGPAL